MAYQAEGENLVPQTRIFVLTNKPECQNLNNHILQITLNLSNHIKFCHPIKLSSSTENFQNFICSLSIVILNLDEEIDLIKKISIAVKRLPNSRKYFIYIGSSRHVFENLIFNHYMLYDALMTKTFQKDDGNILAADICNILIHNSIPLNSSNTIQISVKRQKFFLRLDDILFVITDNQSHKVIFHLKYDEYQVRMTLKQVHHQCRNLTACHEGALVNLKNITKFNKSNRILYFENGDTCEVSRRYTKKISDLIPMKTF